MLCALGHAPFGQILAEAASRCDPTADITIASVTDMFSLMVKQRYVVEQPLLPLVHSQVAFPDAAADRPAAAGNGNSRKRRAPGADADGAGSGAGAGAGAGGSDGAEAMDGADGAVDIENLEEARRFGDRAWTLNHARVFQFYLHDALIKYVGEKVDANAAAIVKAFLDLSTVRSKASKQEQSVQVSASRV